MIGEPELDGVWETERPAGTVEAEAPREPVRGRARPWWWALGGALTASALWAGTLAAQNRFSDAPPRLAYRFTENLCTDAPMTALSDALAKLERDAPGSGEGPALDWSYCSYSSDWSGEDMAFDVQLLVELHKKTDPQAEFAAGPGLTPLVSRGADQLESVPGLGERAVLADSTRGMGARLYVLDGGAVFTLSVEWWGDDAEAEPDQVAMKAAMIEDARLLMATLRKS
ncbi:hypothetical protein [Streptomyces sp. NPDC054849]